MTDPVAAKEVFYARVSTGDQSVDMQVALAKKRGIPDINIYVDNASGRSMKRPGLQEALNRLRPGWALVVFKLDRLGRNLHGLLELLREFEDEGWNLVSLTEQIDTRGPFGRFYLAMLGALAQLESDMTAERTRMGMARKRELGMKLGRRPGLSPQQLVDMEKAITAKPEEALARIAKRFGVNKSNLLYYYPGWRAKTPAERKAHKAKHPAWRKL